MDGLLSDPHSRLHLAALYRTTTKGFKHCRIALILAEYPKSGRDTIFQKRFEAVEVESARFFAMVDGEKTQIDFAFGQIYVEQRWPLIY